MANNTDKKLEDISQDAKKNLEYAKSILNAIPADQQKTLNEIKKLLESNLQLSSSLYKSVAKIQHWIFLVRVWGVLKWILIFIPIILGVIYLPPLLAEMVGKWQALLFELKPQ